MLSRDDGSNLRVNDTVWETALALAFAHGWVPAGTSSPAAAALGGPPPVGGSWNGQDYFSRRSQRVLGEDAIELASALLRGLLLRRQDGPSGAPGAPEAGAPEVDPARLSRAHEQRRNLLRGVAVFARGGGFTID